jgi:hypothetical protein
LPEFANNTMNAFREALGFLTFARANGSAPIALKQKTSKTTTKTTV